MPTESKQWRVFKCPSCESLLKISRDSQARALKCPKCERKVRLPGAKKAAVPASDGDRSAFATPPGDQEAPSTPASSSSTGAPENRALGDAVHKNQSKVLPDQRDYDPTPEGLRVDRESRENWETKRHQRKKLEFGTKLTSTEDEEIKADPNAEPEVRRKRFVGGGSETADSGPSWDDDGTHHGKSGNLPMIIMIVALVLIGTIALLGIGLLDNDAGPRLADTTPVQKAYGLLEQSGDATEFAEDVINVTRKFLEAKSVNELMGYVREPERVAPLARQYYGIHTYEPASYKKLPTARELMSHQKYIVAVVNLEDVESADGIGAVEQQRIIALEQTPSGFKVDWESWVGYSEISWDLFTGQRMADPYEFRAMIGRDDYYNYKYQDFIDWRCYQIRDPEESYRLWGYTPRNGEVDKQLQRALLRSPYTFAIVQLRYPTGNPLDQDAKQVEIVSLIEEGWVKRDDNDYKIEDEMLDGSFDFK